MIELTKDQKINRRIRLIKESKINSYNKHLNRESSKRESYYYIDRAFKVTKNKSDMLGNNSIEHELARAYYCWDLNRLGQEYATEVILKNGYGRVDILNLTSGEIIEIVKSETEKSILLKQKKYPLPVTFIKAETILSQLYNKIEVSQ